MGNTVTCCVSPGASPKLGRARGSAPVGAAAAAAAGPGGGKAAAAAAAGGAGLERRGGAYGDAPETESGDSDAGGGPHLQHISDREFPDGERSGLGGGGSVGRGVGVAPEGHVGQRPAGLPSCTQAGWTAAWDFIPSEVDGLQFPPAPACTASCGLDRRCQFPAPLALLLLSHPLCSRDLVSVQSIITNGLNAVVATQPPRPRHQYAFLLLVSMSYIYALLMHLSKELGVANMENVSRSSSKEGLRVVYEVVHLCFPSFVVGEAGPRSTSELRD